MNPTETPTRPSPDLADLARKGLLALTLAVLTASVLLAYLAVQDIIAVWLETRWVPVWRACFALGVGALAVWVLTRLTDRGLR